MMEYVIALTDFPQDFQDFIHVIHIAQHIYTSSPIHNNTSIFCDFVIAVVLVVT